MEENERNSRCEFHRNKRKLIRKKKLSVWYAPRQEDNKK